MGRNANFDRAADKEVLLSIYRNLLFPSCDSVFFLYTNGKIFDANQRGIELLGYSLEELCELNVTDLITPWDLNEDPLQMPLLQNSQMFVEERNLRRKDGRVIQVEFRAQKLQEELVLGILQDVTAQKENQEIFRQMEDRYRLIVETANEGICTMDENNLITYVNSRLADMLGSSEEEMIGKTMTPFLHDEDLPHYWELMASRQQGNANPVERRFRRKDGSTLWVKISPKPVMDGRGVYRGQFAMFTDITKEKQNDDIQKARLRILQFADSQSLDQLLKETLDILGELSGSPIGFFHFLAKDQITFTRRAWSTQAIKHFGEHAGYTNHQPNDLMGIWFDCIKTRKPVIINEFAAFARKNNLPSGHQDIPRFLILPVLRGEKVLAILGIGGKPSNYIQEDIDVVNSFADLVWDIAERKIAEENLRQHSLQYQAIISTSLDGFSMCSTAGKILEANDAYCRMLGYSRDEILELSIPDIEANETPEDTTRNIQTIMQNGSTRFETRHKCKDGRIIDVEINITYIPDVEFFMVFIRDITDRKRVEEALLDNQELLSLFISRSPIYAFIKEVTPTESRVIQTSNNYFEMIGISNVDMVGKTMPELFPPEFAAKITADDWAVIVNGKVLELDEELNGRSYTTIKFPIQQGEKTLLAGYTIDITDRKQAEDVLSREKQRLANIIKGTDVGTWEWNVQTGVNIFNDRWAEMLGYSLEEISPTTFNTWAKLVHPEDLKHSRELEEKHFKGESDFYECEVRVRHKNGNWVWILARGKVIAWTKDGKPLLMYGTHQDITERKRAEGVLAAQKQKLANIIEGTNAGTWEWNVQTGETTFNDRWAEMIGYSLEEISPTTVDTWEKLCHPDDLVKCRKLLEKHFTGELDYYECEIRLRHKNGNWVWVLDRGKVTVWADDYNPILMYGIHLDITESKLAEEELTKRERLLEESQNIAHLGSYIYDAEANKTHWTKETYSIFELDENTPAPRGVDFEKFIHPEDLELERNLFNDCIQKVNKFDWTYRIITTGGKVRFIRSIGNPECDKNGRLKRFTGTIQDVTESKVLENNLRESEKRFRSLYENIPLGYQSLDPDGYFLDINPAWSKLLGYPPEEIIGKWFGDFLITEDVDLFKQRFPIFKTHGGVQDAEFHMVHKDRHIVTVSFNGQIGYDAWGHVSKTHCNLIDITRRKEMEIKLKASLAEKEVLLREVHHRVKNNLAAILGLLDMERQSTTDQSAEKLLTELSNRIKSMSTVHEKLYRSESLSKIDFQDYLKSFISHLRTSFRTTGDIVNTTDAAGIELSLDLAVPCGLIVNELVTNSMKYAFPEGKPGDQRESECKIIVSMKDEDGRYTLSVGDNGRGLPVDLDWRETRSLGLRLVRMLGEHQLGGTVDLDNTFGAHFTIQFDTLPGEK